ncbi:protein TRI1 [Selaginella moellendorffii]|nr:protein TRI1 [Selaginella moellendorffii]|eukprot:XP_002985445.2 protein TRI1 [Selaginella moellendorffii]
MASASGSAASKAVKLARAAAPAAAKKAGTGTAAAAAAAGGEGRKAAGGLNLVVPISAAGRKFFGLQEMSRIDAMKQMWVYIKSHNLQDPEKKRNILPDEKLKQFLSCKDRIDMTEIPGLLSPHFAKKSAT